jgi:hypothetical protein
MSYVLKVLADKMFKVDLHVSGIAAPRHMLCKSWSVGLLSIDLYKINFTVSGTTPRPNHSQEYICRDRYFLFIYEANMMSKQSMRYSLPRRGTKRNDECFTTERHIP